MSRISTLELEGRFQAAKWLHIQALVEPEELELLFEHPFDLYPLSGAFPLQKFPIEKQFFLSIYRSWITRLKDGNAPDEEELRTYQALAWAHDASALWLQKVAGERYIARPCEPVIQCQVHQMGYSTIDGLFRPMVLSNESIFWGLQFSFPQVYQHPKTGELFETKVSELFQALRKWSREHTVATPMLVDGKRINLPMRLGKRCFSWINNHPHLKAKHLAVMELYR